MPSMMYDVYTRMYFDMFYGSIKIASVSPSNTYPLLVFQALGVTLSRRGAGNYYLSTDDSSMANRRSPIVATPVDAV